MLIVWLHHLQDLDKKKNAFKFLGDKLCFVFFLKENALSTYKAVGGKIRTWSMLLHGSLIPVLPWALRY
jgi:hypothetical protein